MTNWWHFSLFILPCHCFALLGPFLGSSVFSHILANIILSILNLQKDSRQVRYTAVIVWVSMDVLIYFDTFSQLKYIVTVMNSIWQQLLCSMKQQTANLFMFGWIFGKLFRVSYHYNYLFCTYQTKYHTSSGSVIEVVIDICYYSCLWMKRLIRYSKKYTYCTVSCGPIGVTSNSLAHTW